MEGAVRLLLCCGERKRPAKEQARNSWPGRNASYLVVLHHSGKKLRDTLQSGCVTRRHADDTYLHWSVHDAT